MADLLERMEVAITEAASSVAAIQELVRSMNERLTRVEGEVSYVRGVAKGLVERVTAMEALETGAEEGSFAWALVSLRHGIAMRRAKWPDAGRVEAFDWRHWLDGAPDEDLLASDWRRAF